MRAALIGMPQSGKSTVFGAVTGLTLPPEGQPREHLGVVHVPEPRLRFLAELYNPKKIVETTMEFVDVPGCSLADAHGREELRKHLPTIRQADVLVAVVRDFEDPNTPAYRDRVDAAADLAEIWDEFLFADLDAVTTRIAKVEKSLTRPSKTHDQEKRELGVLARCLEGLENEQPISAVIQTSDDARVVSSLAMLTQKPLVALYNVAEHRAGEPAPEPPHHALEALNLSAKTEAEIAQLDAEDRPAFLSDLGLEAAARDRLIRACFKAAGMIVFLTAGGKDEARSWAIRAGSTALEAAGKIHSDLARGFIRAETVAFADLVEAGDMRGAKAAGKVRQEGKTYIVQDGDVITLKFNV